MKTGVTLAGTLGLLLATTGGAMAQGSGQLTGHGALSVRGCHHERADLTTTVSVNADGTWSAVQSEGPPFSGTWTAKGRKGRKFALTFDPTSEAAFLTVVAADVGILCNTPEPVTVTSAVAKIFALVLNRKRTRAKLLVRYVVKGTAGGHKGTARDTIRASGPWVPAA